MLFFESIQQAGMGNIMLFLNILKISKISFWTFWKKNWHSLVSCTVRCLNSTVQTVMINKATTEFWSKFQIHIQILLQFCWRAKQVSNIELVRVLVKNFDSFHHLCALHLFRYFFVVPWLKFKHAQVIKDLKLSNKIFAE